EVVRAGRPQFAGQAYLRIAVAGAEAEEPAAAVSGALIRALQITKEKALGAGIAKARQLRHDVAVQPIKTDAGQIVNFGLVAIGGALYIHTSGVVNHEKGLDVRQ